jgi:serine protease
MRHLAFALLISFLVLAPAALAQQAPTSSITQHAGATSGLRPRKHLVKPVRSRIPVGYDRRRIEVKFQDGLEPDIEGGSAGTRAPGLGSARAADVLRHIGSIGGRWRLASHMDRARLRQLRMRAQLALGREIADLSSYFMLALPPGVEAEAVMDALNDLPEVELAAPAALPTPAPSLRSVPDFEPLQGYLFPAPGGLDSHFAWTIPGGTGAGVAICDMEGGWNLEHEDLPPATVMIPDGESVTPFPVDDHGTEVLGTMFSLPNGWGTTGASYDARCLVAPTYLDSGAGLYQQILWAASQLEAGDVILLEQQTIGPYFSGDGTQFGYVPIEWRPPIYNAILTAVGNGIHVVECAGNGNQNLDAPLYAAGNFGHAPFLPENNSGAIMVGAGIPPTAPELGPDRSRSAFSNFGSRLDVQAWGHRVATTGAGDLFSAEGPNRSFTRFFGGTSSAGPLVASSVASIEGIMEHRAGAAVSPAVMRALLRETGTPQQDGALPASREWIGPRPDLRAAIQRMNMPIVSAPGVVHVYEGETLHLTVDAADLDGDRIEALTVGPLPNGASFSTSTDNTHGELTWDTEVGRAGTYLVIFTASNAAHASDTTRIVVGSAERGPAITGPGGELGVEGGPPIRVTLYATDPNGDPIISFTASNLPRGATFVADSANTSGLLTWRADYDQAGQHIISFTAMSLSRGLGGQEETGNGLLGLTIFNNDRGPVVHVPGSVHGTEGGALSFTVTAADPDGDLVTTLRAEGLPPGAVFESVPSSQTGTVTWTPAFDQAGHYSVVFFGENESSGWAVTTLLIGNLDRAPVVNAPAEIQGGEGQEVVFGSNASDPDGDRIIAFTGEGLPPGSALSIGADNSSALVSWTPRSGDAGQYSMTLTATSRPPGGAALAGSATVVVTVQAGRFAARAYVLPSESTIRLGTGRPRTCVQVEPVDSVFDIGRVDPTTVSLNWTGPGGASAIQAQPMEPHASEDRDHNGVMDFTACFSKDDLRRLFGGVVAVRQRVHTAIGGELLGGGTFEGTVDIDVVPQRGIRDATVTPNPSRGSPVLSFYLSKSAPVRLGIFDVRGRLIGTVLDTPLVPGFHDVPLGDGTWKALRTGIYYYKLETSDGDTTGKFIVLK